MLLTNEKKYRDVPMSGKRERATQPTGMIPPSKAPTNNNRDETNRRTITRWKTRCNSASSLYKIKNKIKKRRRIRSDEALADEQDRGDQALDSEEPQQRLQAEGQS